MTETARLADLITRVIDGDPWHGSTVLALLDGVSHQAAAARSIPGVHSIWELVLHMTGWATDDRVLDRALRDLRDRAAGTGLSHYLTLHGLVHHTAYHAGQIAVLVRAAQALT